jgi:tetratricopeptide (TPR) repeat protein
LPWPSRAKEKFKEALAKNPDELEAITGLADMLILDGKKKEALEVVKPSAGKFAENPLFLFTYAKALGKGTEAESSANKAVGIRSDWAEGYELLAAILYQNENYDKCVETAQKAIDLQSGLTEARKTKGMCLYKKEKYDDAIATLGELMQKVPNAADAMYYIGLSYDAQDNYDKAEESYKNAMNMDTKFADPIVSLGYLYYRTGKPTSSISTMEKALGVNPKSSFAFQVLADIYYERSNWAKARDYYKKAIAGDLVGVDKKAVQDRIKDAEAQIKEKK